MEQKTAEIRKSLKKALVKAFRGCCCCCGYDKSPCSLTFHHLVPSEKRFTFGRVRITDGVVRKLADEARKCVMVCNNCHSEIEAGVREVPADAPCFKAEVFLREAAKSGMR